LFDHVSNEFDVRLEGRGDVREGAVRA
jgi:hypothetical protein